MLAKFCRRGLDRHAAAKSPSSTLVDTIDNSDAHELSSRRLQMPERSKEKTGIRPVQRATDPSEQQERLTTFV